MNVYQQMIRIFYVSAALFANTTLANQFEAETSEEEAALLGVEFQDKKAAQEADIVILAEDTNLPVDSVDNAIEFQQAFGEYADELLARYPNQISAVWVEPVPNLKGHIEFVDEVPPELKNDDQRQQGFILTGNGEISMTENHLRAELTSEALRDLGYLNSITFFDPVKNEIHVELKLPEGVAKPSELELASVVQKRISKTRVKKAAAIIQLDDIYLDVTTGSDPIVSLQSKGGLQLFDRNDRTRRCTSGWSVSGPNGDGIITAGHCPRYNQYGLPGVGRINMSFRKNEFGAGGDVAYYTTSPTVAVTNEFYANSTSIRRVTGIQPTNTMVGKEVCFYGRASNVRRCNHRVDAIRVTIVLSGKTISNLARTDKNTAKGGDSGGGFSYGNTAWGVISAVSSNKSYFTPVQQAEAALGVRIKR